MTSEVRRITAGARQLTGLSDIWHYRELLYFLTWRDVKVRYTQTLLGVTWAVLQPLTLIVLFSVFFSRLVRKEPSDVPYPVFACAGLVPWQLFASSVSASNESVVANERLITRIYFPRMLLPVAAVAAATLDFAIALILLIVLMAVYQVAPGAALLALPLFIALTVVICLGVGIWLAALNAQYRDFRYVTPFLVQAWLFATPVVYSSHVLPQSAQSVLMFNPLTAVVEGFRWCLIRGSAPAPSTVAMSAVFALLLLISGLLYFSRVDDHLADII
jgi:lipopolysaccharide transport system permease protein